MKLTFYGAAGEVTGSNHLLEASDGTKILVDCGLKQGSRFAEEENFNPFPYNPKEIKAVFVTHAHIDHVGKLPKLMKEGFAGEIYSSAPTKDFAELLLLDSEHLLRQSAEELQKEPLYNVEDVENVMKLWHKRQYHEPLDIGPFHIEFFDAGHILGSSFIKIEADGTSIVFSGDLGNVPAPLLRNTEALPAVDYLVMESTYGGRLHAAPHTRKDLLEEAIVRTVDRGGVLMIPAFAMERTQDLLLHIHELVKAGKMPNVPVFMDSPLAIKLTTVYEKYASYFDADSLEKMKSGDDLFDFPNLHYALTTEESKEINRAPQPKVIIAGSGMSNGGRILHHERRYLQDPKSCLLIVGYQAVGTLGRKLLEGAHTVTMFGEEIPVRAEIRVIHSYSAHADQPRLIDWVRPEAKRVKQVYLVHGEREEGEALIAKMREELDITPKITSIGETIEL